MPIPEAIANVPPLHFGFSFYYRAFWDLRSNVTTDNGIISWSDLNDWLSAHDASEEQKEETKLIVFELDTFFRKKMTEKHKRAADLKNAKRNIQGNGGRVPNAGKAVAGRSIRNRK